MLLRGRYYVTSRALNQITHLLEFERNCVVLMIWITEFSELTNCLREYRACYSEDQVYELPCLMFLCLMTSFVSMKMLLGEQLFLKLEF